LGVPTVTPCLVGPHTLAVHQLGAWPAHRVFRRARGTGLIVHSTATTSDFTGIYAAVIDRGDELTFRIGELTFRIGELTFLSVSVTGGAV